VLSENMFFRSSEILCLMLKKAKPSLSGTPS
jgi:hypothetical protein